MSSTRRPWGSRPTNPGVDAMRPWLAAVLAVVAVPAMAQTPAEHPLSFSEQRLLDGAYVYLMAPDYCDPAPDPGRLRAWLAAQIGERGISPKRAANYLADNEPRLRLIAETAFSGRRGKDLCQKIRTAVGSPPMDRKDE